MHADKRRNQWLDGSRRGARETSAPARNPRGCSVLRTLKSGRFGNGCRCARSGRCAVSRCRCAGRRSRCRRRGVRGRRGRCGARPGRRRLRGRVRRSRWRRGRLAGAGSPCRA
ncbi:hypothetical protein GD429_20645 [Burkholderia sp. BE17]|nr:hypothetical protein [Burkholderia sp. BE17]